MVLRLIVGLLLLTLAVPVPAQQVAPVAGKDFLLLNPPQPTEADGRIEVVEFFWYRCPHCYHLEPALDPWIKRLTKDVLFRRIPAIFNDEWAIDARIFYTLEAIGDEARVHRQLFDAIHRDGGVRLQGDAYAKWVADWLGKHGVDMKKYDAAFRSFSVESQLRRAGQLSRSYRLDGVPSIAVQGRYVVTADLAGDRILDVTDAVIGEARKKPLKR